MAAWTAGCDGAAQGYGTSFTQSINQHETGRGARQAPLGAGRIDPERKWAGMPCLGQRTVVDLEHDLQRWSVELGVLPPHFQLCPQQDRHSNECGLFAIVFALLRSRVDQAAHHNDTVTDVDQVQPQQPEHDVVVVDDDTATSIAQEALEAVYRAEGKVREVEKLMAPGALVPTDIMDTLLARAVAQGALAGAIILSSRALRLPAQLAWLALCFSCSTSCSW